MNYAVQFPASDLEFIRKWLAWTDQHKGLLRGQRPLPIAPGHGKVDGSYAVRIQVYQSVVLPSRKFSPYA